MNTPYAIIPIGTIILLFYLLTLLASRLGVFSTGTHRRFWNILLLLFFLGTAFLGLFLAIQVNYKLEIALADRLLVWHVDFGIGLAMVAIFHLLWHINYYIRIFRKGTSGQADESDNEPVVIGDTSFDSLDKSGFLSLLILGFTTVIMQIVVLREFMAVFYGNELVIGLTLAVWMTLTGLGAMGGRYASPDRTGEKLLAPSLIVLTLLPFLTVFLLYYLRNIVFLPGSLPNILEIIISSLVLLAPFCLLSGFLFTHLSARLSRENKKNLIGEAYAAESAGSIIGGILVSFILVFFFSTFRILSFLLAINILLISFSPQIGVKPKLKAAALILSLSVILFVNIADLDRISRSFIFRNQKVVFMKDTPYGNVSITETAGQLNFYENYKLIFTTQDQTMAEEDVHYTMIQHRDPDSVLLVSGGISGTLSEISKYDVELIDYVEINPWIIRAGREFTSELDNEASNIISKDARRYIRNTEKKYDVILINIPQPETAQLNRYFTLEFYTDLKAITKSGSVIGLALPSTMNYVSEEASVLYSSIYNTVSVVFDNLLIIPGSNNNYLLASDSRLSIDIPGMMEVRGPETVYVNSYYLDSLSLAMRSDEITRRIDTGVDLNTDFRPLGYFHHLRMWLSQYDMKYWVLITLAGLLLIAVIIRSNVLTFGIFAGGFAASSIEILIILSFQIMYGYVYHFTGIIITFFMLGLVIGVVLYRKLIPKTGINHFILIQVGIGVYALLFPFVMMLMQKSTAGDSLLPLFVLLTMLIAALTAMLFTGAVRLSRDSTVNTSARIYSYDLIGSATGALLVSVFLIPLVGIFQSAWIIGIINLVAALFAFLYRSKYIE